MLRQAGLLVTETEPIKDDLRLQASAEWIDRQFHWAHHA
jgi:hypothetical protein